LGRKSGDGGGRCTVGYLDGRHVDGLMEGVVVVVVVVVEESRMQEQASSSNS